MQELLSIGKSRLYFSLLVENNPNGANYKEVIDELNSKFLFFENSFLVLEQNLNHRLNYYTTTSMEIINSGALEKIRELNDIEIDKINEL